ncbi:hypothetical protein [Treponema pedis]|uniref:hypothetical protein n=1 Tax=Treponema pedis TaxID=409322 RepID=UPI0004236D19|nr:hypothetical protein [Treponema pedis]
MGVAIETKHIFYNWKNIEKNKKDILKFYDAESLVNPDLKSAIESNQKAMENDNFCGKYPVVIIRTKETHKFTIETINRYKKIKEFKFHIDDYEIIE